jgi:Glycosyltransferases, probably involved in cell wall biogenesis
MLDRIKRYYRKNNGFIGTCKAISNAVKKFGLKNVLARFVGVRIGAHTDYQYWINNIEKKYVKADVESELEKLKLLPKISCLIPVYNVGEEYLRACIDSIRNQYYQNWELCIADDFSTATHIRQILEEYVALDERIKVVFREKNGHISEATNSALELATGEYIALVDNDDVLKSEALFEFVRYINKYPDADMLYSDEDKINEEGTERLAPAFKPDWSPDAFLSQMYLCHLGVYRTSIAREIGGFRSAYNGAQDYDFALRFTEQTTAIYHVPYILYHWRMLPTSTASSGDNKDYAFDANIQTKMDVIKRRGYDAKLINNEAEFATNFTFNPQKNDFLSIIIPTENRVASLNKCLNSIYEKSTWKNFEIIIIDNSSRNSKMKLALQKICQEHENIVVLPMTTKFNFAAFNNEAVKIAKGNFLCFLNDDTEIITPNWMELMIGQAGIKTTGVVGARLLYNRKALQQVGIVMLGKGLRPYHAYAQYNRNDLGRMRLNYNYLALSATAMVIEKVKFIEMGMFDAQDFANGYSDIDLCIKLYNQGYFNVCRGDVEFYHYNKKNIGFNIPKNERNPLDKELAILQKKWDKYVSRDPFYNINLSKVRGDFSINLVKKIK